MKKSILLALALCCILTTNAQVSNLADLSFGRLESFYPLFEKDNDLYGYLALYYIDRVNENEEKYSYVILDKNLNNVSNGEFVDTYYNGIQSEYITPQKIGDKVMLTKSNMSVGFGTITAFTSNRLLDINNKALDDSFYFQDDEFKTGFRLPKGLKKSEKKIPFFYIPVAAANGFLMVEITKPNLTHNPSKLAFYNANREKIWNKRFDFIEAKGKTSFDYETFDEKSLYLSFNSFSGKNQLVTIRRLDINSGEQLFEYQLSNSFSEYNYSFIVESVNDQTIITGEISPFHKNGFRSDKVCGLFKIVLDSEGNEIFKKHFLWQEASEFIDLDEEGKVEKGYMLKPRKYFVLKNGSIVMLTEKMKYSYNFIANGTIPKTTDFVIFNFDKDFNISEIEVIEKDLTKFSTSDYLYSQDLNDGNDGVFFYQDYIKDDETKEKSWILGIVTLIDGKINHETIPISSEDYFIYPYIAKEGYILLREINKDAEFDEIRLEKLNY